MKVSKNCATCGTVLLLFRCRVKTYNFCSRICADKAQAGLTNIQSPPWTKQEIEILRHNYQTLGPSGFEVLLPGRDKKQITGFAHRQGFKTDRGGQVGMSDGWIRRFWRRIEKGGIEECWNWLGNVNSHGYGTVRLTPEPRVHKSIGTHRAAWELTYGPVTDGRYVLHKNECNNRRCCNPNHLYLGDAQKNAEDRDGAGHGPAGKRRNSLEVDDVVNIRKMAKAGVPLTHIAKLHGIAYPTAIKAATGATWKHVLEPPLIK